MRKPHVQVLPNPRLPEVQPCQLSGPNLAHNGLPELPLRFRVSALCPPPLRFSRRSIERSATDIRRCRSSRSAPRNFCMESWTAKNMSASLRNRESHSGSSTRSSAVELPCLAVAALVTRSLVPASPTRGRMSSFFAVNRADTNARLSINIHSCPGLVFSFTLRFS